MEPMVVDIPAGLLACPAWWQNFIHSIHPAEDDIPDDYDYVAVVNRELARYGMMFREQGLIVNDPMSYIILMAMYED